MLDAGLRISEACSINAKILILKIEILPFNHKKRGVKHLRTIPISNRLYQAIGNI
jgi:hypothetical protein